MIMSRSSVCLYGGREEFASVLSDYLTCLESWEEKTRQTEVILFIFI